MISIISFLGSNCEEDSALACSKVGLKYRIIFHTQNSLPKNTKAVILPGGFSYGDYLRCGALGKTANIMKSIKKFADSGGIVIGICNGFQILTQAGMLPGALKINTNLSFMSKMQYLKVCANDNTLLDRIKINKVLNIPIANHDGNYYINKTGLKKLKKNNQILFKYCNKNGSSCDINGSVNSIAGICNERKNIFGFMPHPERAISKLIGGVDGLAIFKNIAINLEKSYKAF